MQVFRVFGIVPDARSPSRSFEIPVDPTTAGVADAGSYKTTALPIELGRRGFPNDSRIIRSNLKPNTEVLKTTALPERSRRAQIARVLARSRSPIRVFAISVQVFGSRRFCSLNERASGLRGSSDPA